MLGQRMEMARGDSDDDGFDDFLSEDEEECALRTQEMDALARKMKSVGVREAIEFGKESTLQEGFDDGFRLAARDAFRFGALRGVLSVALVSGMTSAWTDDDVRELETCVEQLRVRALRVPTVEVTNTETIVNEAVGAAQAGESQAADTKAPREEEDAALLLRATNWARRMGMESRVARLLDGIDE